MKNLNLILFFFLLTGTIANISAQGTTCAGATSITVGTSCTPTSFTVNGGSENPTSACAATGESSWATFVGDGSDVVITYDVTNNNDPVVRVFSGACGGLVEEGCADDFGSGSGSELETVNISTTNGTTYYIQVLRFTGTGGSMNGNLCAWTCTADEGSAPTVAQTGNGTNNLGPYVLCRDSDAFVVTNPGDQVLPPPVDGANLGYAIYACAPTTNDPDTDPCWTGYYITGDFTDTNDANNLLDFIIANPVAGEAVPSTSSLYYAAITMDDACNDTGLGCDTNLGHDINGDGCFSMDFNEAFEVVYLDDIVETSTTDCGTNTVSVTLNGGYPAEGTGNFTVTNTGAGTISTTTVSEGGTVDISGLSVGDVWSVDVTDSNGCPRTFSSTYGCLCGTPPTYNAGECNNAEDLTIDSPFGVLYDDGGPSGDATAADAIYRYTICSPDGEPIDIDITTDFTDAVLEVYDGPSIYLYVPGAAASLIYTGENPDVSLGTTSNTTVSLTSTNALGCITIVWRTLASTTGAGFSLAWTTTGSGCEVPHYGDDALTGPGYHDGSLSGPSYDECDTPLSLAGSSSTNQFQATNINSTSGEIGTCDPDPTLIPGQSTVESTVYFQYCTGSCPETLSGTAVNTVTGSCVVGSGVGVAYFEGGTPGNGCYDNTFTAVTLSPGDVLPANTCYTILIDGAAGSECDFDAYFETDKVCDIILENVTLVPNPATCTYSLDVQVSYLNEPSGDITINYGIGSTNVTPTVSSDCLTPSRGVETFTITGLPDDGSTYDVNTLFTDAPICLDADAGDGTFTLTTFVPGCPVPVELLDFRGEAKGEINALSWTTATEINNRHFEVQRSINGSDFETIGIVEGNGNSSVEIDYAFDDTKPAAVSYYRLKQVDFDGAFEYSDVIKISRKVRGLSLSSVYPSPTRGNTNIVFNTEKSMDLTISIIDVTGRVLGQYSISAYEGTNQTELDLSAYSNGMYMIVLESSDTREITRIIKH